MKKTLAALAVLGAFAGTSLAADVTLYGVIDTGFNWTNVKKADGTKTDTFQMASGQNSGPRFGLKGTEDLGNGLVVGFNLENSFNSDDGGLEKNEGRLFHREAIMFVRGGFGEVAMGRTGSLDAGTGTYNLIGSKATAMGTGWDNIGKESKIFSEGSRYDNTLTYKTPTFGGVTLYAQGSLKINNKDAKDGDEGSSKANRYYAIGATAKFGALNAGLVASETDWARDVIGPNGDDRYAVTGYVNYDFGMIKPMLAVQWFDEGSKVAAGAVAADEKGGQKGYGVVAGFTAPVVGGSLKFTAGYRDAELAADAIKDSDCKNFMVGVGYEYPLSKRTFVYTAAGYMKEQVKIADVKKTDTKTTEVMAGLVHKF